MIEVKRVPIKSVVKEDSIAAFLAKLNLGISELNCGP